MGLCRVISVDSGDVGRLPSTNTSSVAITGQKLHDVASQIDRGGLFVIVRVNLVKNLNGTVRACDGG